MLSQLHKIDNLRYFTDYVAAWRKADQELSREPSAQGAREWRMAHWGGGGAVPLGLSGAIDGVGLDQFVALGEKGLAPSGDPLIKRVEGSVQAHGLTFSPVKSVSVLWAGLGTQAQRDLVLDAHLAAVDAAMAVWEREAMRVRRGHAGRDGQLRAGAVWGSFLHLASREGDPQIHSHVVVENAALGEDERWSAWTGRAKPAQRITSAVYRHELERNLTEVFGVEWTPPDPNGNREIVGFERRVLRGHSKRRQQIERHMADAGVSGRDAAQLAAIRTRRRKDVGAEVGRPHDELVASLARFGVTPERIEAEVLGRSSAPEPVPHPTEIAAEVLARLTAERSAFSRGDVALALDSHVGGASAAELEALIDGILASHGVVELAVVTADGTPLAPGSGTKGLHTVPLALADPGGTSRRRWTTQKILDQEAEIDHWVVIGRGRGVAVCKERDVERAITRRGLDPAAAEMVRRLTLGGDRIALAEGPPGTGKTFALGAAARAWAAAGYRVRGTATSARAARELADGAGIDAENSTVLLDAWDQWGRDLPDNHTVLIIDEASMVSTSQLHALCGWVRDAGGKIVLVGDSRQLAAVERGGMFARLCAAHEHPVLTGNVRQADPADVAAIEDLRAGRAALAAGSFARRGRLVTVKDFDEAPRVLAVEYLERAARGQQVLLGAATRDEVAALNGLVRAARVAAGELGETVMTVEASEDQELSEREFAVGDRVLARRNKKSLGIENADRGVVEGVSKRRGASRLVVRLERGGAVMLPEDYVQDHLDHGYASTLHRTQGATVGRALRSRKDVAEANDYGWVGLLGGERARLEAVLVAASRATDETTIVVTTDALDECFGPDVLGEGPDPMERAVRAWAELSGEPAASCEAEVADRVERLATETGREELVARREELAPLTTDARVDLAGELAAATARADEAREGADGRAIRLADERARQLSARLDTQRETDLVAVRAELAVVDAALDRERRVRISAIVVDQPADITALVGEAPEERAAWLRHYQAVGAVEDVTERVVRNRTGSQSPAVQAVVDRAHVLSELDRALGAKDHRALEEIVDDETHAGALAAATERCGQDLTHPAMQRQVRAITALVGPERAPAEAADAVRNAGADAAGPLVATTLRLRTESLVTARRRAGQDVPMAVALASSAGWGIPEVRAASEIATYRAERGMDTPAPVVLTPEQPARPGRTPKREEERTWEQATAGRQITPRTPEMERTA